MCDDVSPLTPLVAGVLQGSPILLLFFSLFIEVLEFSKYHMYVVALVILFFIQLCLFRNRLPRKLTVAFNAWVR
jgi:hypothetical protein